MGYYIKAESNVKIYVEDLNENGTETILFLHGWPGDHNLFEYQFDYFSKMGYRCIGLDQRGFGESDKPLNGYDLVIEIYMKSYKLELAFYADMLS